MDIYIYGDSHSRSYTTKRELLLNNVTDNKINVNLLNMFRDSSTIRGLINENSTLKYGEYIINAQQKNINKENSVIVLKFGQVDLEYSFFFKKIIKNEEINFNDFCKELINFYQIFIDRLISIHHFKIIVSSLNLPNYYTDEYLKKCLIYIFEKIYQKELIILSEEQQLEINKISVLQITENTMYFNNMLKEMCNKTNILFLDTTEKFYDSENKKLKSEYLGVDNHYINVGGSYDDGDVQTIFRNVLFDLL